jgi:hypothetical protein
MEIVCIDSTDMSTEEVLKDGWPEYKLRKLRLNENPLYFVPAHAWEVSFLVKKIHGIYAYISEQEIKEAITHCTEKLMKPPYERKALVKCVLDYLQEKQEE